MVYVSAQADRLSFLEAFGPSVANVSPTLTPAVAVAGWAMLAAYASTAMAFTAATALFVQSLVTAVGLPSTIPSPILFLVIAGLVYLFAIGDIWFSSRLGLGLEVVSVAIIAPVCLMSWQAYGFALDPNIVQGFGDDTAKLGAGAGPLSTSWQARVPP